jgi:hypothetical protein
MQPSFSDDGKWTPNRRIALSIIKTVAPARKGRLALCFASALELLESFRLIGL